MMRDGFLAFIFVPLMAVGGAAAGPPPSEDFVLNCSGCHRLDGSGATSSVPSLVGLDRYLLVPEGREYLVRAPGVAQAPLSDARLAALLNWMVATFGEAFSPRAAVYSAAEVGLLRADPIRDTGSVRAKVLDQISSIVLLNDEQ